MSDDVEWLAGLKVGDPVVATSSGAWAKHGHLVKVARFTPTQIVTTGGSRYRRKDGHGVGGSDYSFSWIVKPTVERESAIKAEQTLKQVEAIRWKDVPMVTLETVLGLVNEPKKAER